MGRVTLPRRVALDTNVFVFGLEGSGPIAEAVRKEILGGLGSGNLEAVTSMVSLAELAVGPYQAGLPWLVDELIESFRSLPNLTVLPLDEALGRVAAQVRAETRLRLPDAIQLAAGIVWGAEAIVTNDKQIASRSSLPVILLDDLTGQVG